MSARTVEINFRINYPVMALIVLLLHLGLMEWKNVAKIDFSSLTHTSEKSQGPAPIQLRQVRTVGAKDSRFKGGAYLSKSDSKVKTISKEPLARPARPHAPLSLKDLTAAGKMTQVRPSAEAPAQQGRPGSRPDLLTRPKALTGISLQGGREMSQFAQGGGSSSPSVSGGVGAQTASLANSDIAVNLEVPEGVSPDELNKYELMFYGFQRRTAIGYVNAFYKHLDKFQKENPHLNFPMTETKQMMTGRLTYDEKGNIKQIKMIRWSNIQRLQDFFVEVLQDMDTLQNPPHSLWEKNGEFSIFFSFVVNG